ncbi:MAG: PaaI family thioesterase [Dehalococcoidia bacterium]
MTTNDDLLASLQELYSGQYWALLGIETTAAGAAGATCRVRLEPKHFNYNGVVHGGVISGLIDSTAGAAVRSIRKPDEIAARPHATSDLHVTYLAPASGEELIAHGRVLRRGRTAIFTEVDVFDVRDGQERQVARGTVTFVIAPAPPVRPEE